VVEDESVLTRNDLGDPREADATVKLKLKTNNFIFTYIIC